MMKKREKLKALEELLDIMDELRVKCPWDREQTMETLRTLTIEETYELADAILDNNYEEVKRELGDLLLHIVFYAKIGEEKNLFDIGDVARSINKKLIYRHPHVFGDTRVNGSDEVKENWEHLKISEDKNGNRKVLGGVPGNLPAMIKAFRIQDKVRGVGFDWKERENVWEKVIEEISEVRSEIGSGDHERLEEEFGDLFFSLINAARLYGINPENALERTNLKFIQRFTMLEEKARERGKSLKDMTLEDMDFLWEEAKKTPHPKNNQTGSSEIE
ncbi:MAG: nucleoside triphosphate pyrophosphohydrolase [Bacteroidales bacterium]